MFEWLRRTPRIERIALMWGFVLVLSLHNRDLFGIIVGVVGMIWTAALWIAMRRSRRIVTASPHGRPYRGAGVGVRYRP